MTPAAATPAAATPAAEDAIVRLRARHPELEPTGDRSTWLGGVDLASPCGRLVAVVEADGTATVLDARRGRPARVVEYPPPSPVTV